MTYPHSSERRTHPAAWAALGLAVVALAGVAWLILRPREVTVSPGGAAVVEAIQSQAALEDAMPACSEVFVPGKVVSATQVSAGCKSPSGEVQYLGFFTCADGRLLFSLDARTGAPVGWGFSGGKYRAVSGEVAADPGYGRASETCKG